jgi:hypothetical protein
VKKESRVGYMVTAEEKISKTKFRKSRLFRKFRFFRVDWSAVGRAANLPDKSAKKF